MEFWNFTVPAVTFLAPVLVILFLLFSRQAGTLTERRFGAGVFGLTLAAAVVGIVHFESPVRLEMLWPLTGESSGYFEFAFQLYWIRYVWIFFTASLLLAFVAFDGRAAFEGGGSSLKFLFLAGALFFSSLAFLSENVFLSLMFIEITVFLLHAFSVRTGGEEGSLEMTSYFKRSGFIFVSLAAMLGLAATEQFSVNSIVLLGIMLYVMSFVLSKHNFLDWRYLPLVLMQASTVFFLLGRVMKEDMSAEVWLPLAGIFGLSTAIFSGLSLLSPGSLGASFWMVFALLGYFLFQRFSAPKPEDLFWGVHEAVGLGAAFALSTLLRQGRILDQGWKKAAGFLLTIVLLGIVTGGLPGVDIGGARGGGEAPALLLAYGSLSFLLALIAGKALMASFSQSSAPEDRPSLALGFAPAVVVVLAHIGFLLRMTDIYGESPYRLGLPYLMSNPLVAVSASAVGLGLAAGALLGSNSRFTGWIRNKERRLEDLFPRLDPTVIRWNERVARTPGDAMDWLVERMGRWSDRMTAYLQQGDRLFFGHKFFRGFRHYGSSLSHVARFFHTGSVRAYLFMGILVTLFSSLIFLLEGK